MKPNPLQIDIDSLIREKPEPIRFSAVIRVQNEEPTFDGKTFDQQRDGKRLGSQLDSVKALMLDGKWHQLPELVNRCGGTEASVSARLRDLRKEKFGGYTIDRRYVKHGIFEYRLCS